jgi:hypothetical protein
MTKERSSISSSRSLPSAPPTCGASPGDALQHRQHTFRNITSRTIKDDSNLWKPLETLHMVNASWTPPPGTERRLSRRGRAHRAAVEWKGGEVVDGRLRARQTSVSRVRPALARREKRSSDGGGRSRLREATLRGGG